ncbi:MAG: hypothetical protein JW726_13890 [Anaerolineales bacterium]|nr:hypothetical protein [Anaerolineales bacterium]
MKRKWILTILLILLALLISAATLQASGYALDWWTVDAGGGVSQDAAGRYSLNGTIGQPDAAETSQGSGFTLQGGFWSGGGTLKFINRLPMVLKQP